MYLVRDCSLQPSYNIYHDLYLGLTWKDTETFLDTYYVNRFIYITDEVIELHTLQSTEIETEVVDPLPIHNLKFNNWHTTINAELTKSHSYHLILDEPLQIVEQFQHIHQKYWIGDIFNCNLLRFHEMFCSDAFSCKRSGKIKVEKTGSLIIVFNINSGNIKDI